jgi:predicted transcriptional regulator
LTLCPELANFAEFEQSRRVWDLRGQHSKAARHLLGWSVADLARASGVSKPTIGRFESGEADVKVSTLRSLVDVFKGKGIVFEHHQASKPFVQCDDGVRVSIAARGSSTGIV